MTANRMRKIGLLAAVAFAALVPAQAFAQASGDILNQIVDQFQSASSGWAGTMQGFALGLFGLLATISFFYNTIMYALRGEAQLYGWMGHVVKEILRIGFWFAVLLSATSWIPAIVNSLRQAGEAAGGMGSLNPSNVMSVGINIAGAMLERSAGPGGLGQVIGAGITEGLGAALGAGLTNFAFQFAALVMVCIFAYMALQVIIALVEMYFVTSAGVLFIGMGGSPWTSDFAVKTLVYAVSVGAKLMVMALILSLGLTVARQWMNLDYTEFRTSIIIIGCAVVLAGVVKMVPELVQGMIQGASMTSAAPMIGAAQTMAAAAGAAATAGVGAGVALHSATTMAAGQLGAATAAGAGPTSAGGRAAFMLSNTAKNLAGSAAQDIGGKLAGSNRHGTMGGRMAAAMNDQMKREEKAPSPGGGGSGGGGAGGGSGAAGGGGGGAGGGGAGGGVADAAALADAPSVTISGAGEGGDAGGGEAGASGGGSGASGGDAPGSAPTAGGGTLGGRASGGSGGAPGGAPPAGGAPSSGAPPASGAPLGGTSSSSGGAPTSSGTGSSSAPRSGGVVSGGPRPGGGVVSGGPAGGGSLISGGPAAPPPPAAGSYSSPAVSLGDALGGYGPSDSDPRRGIGEAPLAEDQQPNYQPVDSDSTKGLGESPTRRPRGPLDHLRGPGNDNESG
jgi:type IV secretion system protein TrbL